MSAPLRLPIGFHDDVASVDYHRDPAFDPSLSSHVARTIFRRTPLRAWTDHPRLNPAHEPDGDTKFSVGSVAHEMVLGRGGGFSIVEADDWRKKEAKEARDDAFAAGRMPILQHQYEAAAEMARAVVYRLEVIPQTAVLFHPESFGFANGKGEQVMIWRDPGGPLCRAMMDWRGPDETMVWDLKTTAIPLDDASLVRHIDTYDYDLQAAFYIRGLSTLIPDLAGRFRWRWVFVSDSAPFEVRVIEASPAMVELGDRKAALAIEKWRKCIETGIWPSYAADITTLDPTPWAIDAQVRRETEDDDAVNFRPMSRPVVSERREMLGAC